ncbi:hypothetical protein ACROYT_G040600 [Oculina patagonica]
MVLLFLLRATFTTSHKCQGNSQNFRFVEDQNVVFDHALEGHVFKMYTVNSATECHMLCRDDCLCISTNYSPNIKENNCELNDASKEMKTAALKHKPGTKYYDLVRSYTVEGGRLYEQGKHRCVNKCCQPNPCFQGGECQEICVPHEVRFKCTCPANYTGRRCEHKCYGSCKGVLDSGVTQSGRFIICDGQSEPFYVYCDIESESNYVWTLIQSFSFAQRFFFSHKPFGDNYPIGYDRQEINWSYYRLSLPHMKYIASQSTHLRATCNFATESLQYIDYARAKLENHYIFTRFERKCRPYERLNIRGIQCYSCTALTNQRNGKAWYIDSYTSNANGCQFDGRPGMGTSEYNFGWYPNGQVNTDH